jgi:hypothetical protein
MNLRLAWIAPTLHLVAVQLRQDSFGNFIKVQVNWSGTATQQDRLLG